MSLVENRASRRERPPRGAMPGDVGQGNRVVGSYRGKDCAGVLRRQMPALTALGCLGAVALPVPGALAACAPATGSNITVTCSGVTVNQGPGINTGYGDGTQNGLTVNVQSGASVTGANTGIDVNANATINNFGTIT